jgi:L-2-hydroxyglutarate oxidase LhgO
MDRVECVVVGAGVVGLAVAQRLAGAGREVLVLEAAERIGTGTSSRNSEVIHAGLYYPAGSLKARLCIAGRDALYAYCARRGIAHRRLGKLIVATDPGQIAKLESIARQAEANGAGVLEWLEPGAVSRLEPAVRCVRALLSPATGIIDSHGYMLALQSEIEEEGGMVVCRAPVLGGRVTGEGFALRIGGREPAWLGCRLLVNSAGLGAQALARQLEGVPPATVPPGFLAKGNYYALQGLRPPFGRLVYPVPEEGGLGVHVTLDLAGQVRFGPDVEWVEQPGYDVAPARAEVFYAAIRRYWPQLPDHALVPAYAGLRPKLAGPGEGNPDFIIQGPEAHRIPGLVNLYGIESPGLTASLAIADLVAEQLATA